MYGRSYPFCQLSHQSHPAELTAPIGASFLPKENSRKKHKRLPPLLFSFTLAVRVPAVTLLLYTRPPANLGHN
jgi:hypothetical protein